MGQRASFICDECGSPSVTVFGSETTQAIVTCSRCNRVIGDWNDYLAKVSAGMTVVWNIQSADPPIRKPGPASHSKPGSLARKPTTPG